MTKATLDPFQSALLGELLGVVDERAARRTRRQRLRRRIGATVAAAAGVGAAFLAAQPGPAYAIAEQDDGDIVVTIHRLEDPQDLEQSLAEHGVRAKVDYTEPRQLDVAGEPGSTVSFIPTPSGAAGSPGSSADCGFGPKAQVSLEARGSEYVVTIHPGAPLLPGPLEISAATTTDSAAVLVVVYDCDRCALMARAD